MADKKRVLWVSEASFLSTGFSTLSMEILKRLHNSNKYELAEMGSYASSDDPRASYLPWQFYGAIPHEQDTLGKQRYSGSVYGQFGEALFEQVCLDFRPDLIIDSRDSWMCIKSGLVWMGDGSIKDIQNITANQNVITHLGRSRKVTNSGSRTHNGVMVKITPSVLAFPLDVTYNHPILSMKKNDRQRYPDDINNAKFVDAQDLEIGDYVFFPIPNYDVERSQLSNDQLFALGFFLAEGCYLKHKDVKDGIQISGHKLETIVIENAIKSLASLVDDATIHKISTNGKTNSYVARAGSRKLANLLYEWFGEYANRITIPPWIIKLPNDQLAIFLKGLINGDGCCNPITKRGAYYSVSKELALQVWTLLNKLMIPCSVSKGNTKIGEKSYERYLIAISKKYFDQFDKLYNEGKLLSGLKEFDRFYQKDGVQYILLNIKKIEKYKEECTVYNLEVEEDHTFVSQFATHNCEFQLKSPFRDNYKIIWCPTIDGEPQRLEWLDYYSRADSILTYSKYGKDVLEREAPGKIKVFDIVRPGVNQDIHKPMDKAKIRTMFGIPQDAHILMTVMRNQRRKLYADLIETFAQYLQHCRDQGNEELANKSYLYMHTSYPDVGFDISKHIMNHGVGHRVLVTYMCNKCHACYIDHFQTELTACKKCGTLAAGLPNTQMGVSREDLAVLMNIGDLYIQYSICEGLGMPIAEAKACGVPAMAVDYSAMSEQVEVEGCQKIRVEKFFHEPIVETEQKRALPDNNDAVEKIYNFFMLPPETKKRYGELARKDAVENYSFDRAASIFEKAIDSLEIHHPKDTWYNPKPNLLPRINEFPRFRNNADFIDWSIDNILKKSELKESYWRNDIIKSLNVGYAISKGGRQRFDHEAAAEMFNRMADENNFWESMRVREFSKNEQKEISWVVV